MADKHDEQELLLRVRRIDNGYLLLGRAYGERLPQKYFADLDVIEEEMISHLHDHFVPHDNGDMEGDE